MLPNSSQPCCCFFLLLPLLLLLLLQSSGLVEVGGGDDVDSDVSAGGGVNLLQLDVTQSQEDLDYIAGMLQRVHGSI